ncbi:medium chain dehydrogenase/reductase family protein [Flagellimonas meishanensis]|uniref:medium chain dehydrogenase/reductase family protein n=1 Tax=Flagellimonas meishanensis TaxID=2873264 RepID=UPI001CA777D8|nr:medium chain dehydrogenase/reductase family protein [[Muricauda] meishanensis]
MGYNRIIITRFGGPEVMQMVEESALPEPKEGEVRIKVLKTCANFTDIMIRKGKYPDVKDKPPFSPGYDMVGVVDKLGKGVEEFKVGDRVADMTVIGAYSEYICLPAVRLTRLPDNIDASEAVTLILSYMAAYQMLHRIAKISKGNSILIHGAGGAVGIAMLQLGKLLNLKMYGTASKSKHDLVEKHGGIPIDYKEEDFVKCIQKLTNNGVDVAFDPIGGENFKKSFKSLKSGGRLVAFGFYNAVMGKGGNIPMDFIKILLWNILPNRRKASFYSIGGLRKKHPEWFKEDLQALFKLLEKGKIRPEISNHFTLDKAKEAHEKIEKAEIKGKIIFDVS